MDLSQYFKPFMTLVSHNMFIPINSNTVWIDLMSISRFLYELNCIEDIF